MPETLLQTKLYVPPLRPNLVPRYGLLERMDQGLRLGHKLTLISAPAGFGKTTLAAEWVKRKVDGGRLKGEESEEPVHPAQVAWLSLDEEDSDLTRFMTYFISALQSLSAEIGQGALAMLQSPQSPPADTILTSVVNELAATETTHILVLDDYHLIQAGDLPGTTAINQALTFLLEHAPPQMHLVLATRVDPDLSLARLRARGQLTELRAIDLRFTPEEAANFLNQVMGLKLSPADIAALEKRTEGWIAGLQLAALALQGYRTDSGDKGAMDFISSFSGSHRFVLDYLMEEVIEQQPRSVQSFMLQTAVLSRLCGSLCDAVTGENNGREILQAMERGNLFVVGLDEERRWYRYHHLFADLLQQRLRQSQPEIEPILHLRAGEWFSRHGLDREAIKHSLAAGDYEGAAGLIKAIAINIMQQGEHTTVAGWIDTLPDEFVKEQPYLCVLHAWALQLTGQMEEAEARLVDAEKVMDRQKDQDADDADTILGLIHSHRAYLTFMVGELERTVYHAQQALVQLPASATLIRVQTALYLGVAYRYQGRLQEAMDVYEATLPITYEMGGKSIVVLCYLHLADFYWELGQLHRAKELCQQALEITERYTGRPERPYTGFVYVRIGRILRQWNQLEEAYRLINKGVVLCRDWNVADILALSIIELADIHQALGNEEQSQASILEAIQIYESFSPWGVRYGEGHKAIIDLERGDIAAAERWAETVDLNLDGEFEFYRENEYLALARVLIVQKRFEEARTLTEQIYQSAREIEKKGLELVGLILLALLLEAQGERDRAISHLEKALAIGEPEGFIRVFVDEGPPLGRLLSDARSRGIAPAYVRQLLAAFAVEERGEAEPSKPQVTDSDLAEPLSEREVEVLQYIAVGLSNREIADRLYLSLNTIKVHTRNLYSKLAVNSRTQAVARARELGILDNR